MTEKELNKDRRRERKKGRRKKGKETEGEEEGKEEEEKIVKEGGSKNWMMGERRVKGYRKNENVEKRR